MKSAFRFPRPLSGLTAAALLLGAGTFWQPTSARATAFTYSGTLTTTRPTYNRPLSTTSLSSVGTAVYYDVEGFTLSAAGTVTLSVDSATFTPTPADDSYLVIYQNSFNPASPLTNILAIDDDSGPGSLSLITATLQPGVQYFLVTSPYYNATTGPFQDSITPATGTTIVTPFAVPEPGSLSMLTGMGLLGLASWGRRKRKV